MLSLRPCAKYYHTILLSLLICTQGMLHTNLKAVYPALWPPFECIICDQFLSQIEHENNRFEYELLVTTMLREAVALELNAAECDRRTENWKYHETCFMFHLKRRRAEIKIRTLGIFSSETPDLPLSTWPQMTIERCSFSDIATRDNAECAFACRNWAKPKSLPDQILL